MLKRSDVQLHGRWIGGVAAGVGLVTLLLMVLRRLLVVVTVQHHSMLPTLRDGDRVLMMRHWPQRWLRCGQIVVLWPWPKEEPLKDERTYTPYIKRVVGLPGDTVSCAVPSPTNENSGCDGLQTKWSVPPDHCFVLSDLPGSTFDSRTWGPVPLTGIIGVVVARLPAAAS